MGLMNCVVQDICLLLLGREQVPVFFSMWVCPGCNIPLWMVTLQRSLCYAVMCTCSSMCLCLWMCWLMITIAFWPLVSLCWDKEAILCHLSWMLSSFQNFFYFKQEKVIYCNFNDSIVSNGLDKVIGFPIYWVYFSHFVPEAYSVFYTLYIFPELCYGVQLHTHLVTEFKENLPVLYFSLSFCARRYMSSLYYIPCRLQEFVQLSIHLCRDGKNTMLLYIVL